MEIWVILIHHGGHLVDWGIANVIAFGVGLGYLVTATLIWRGVMHNWGHQELPNISWRRIVVHVEIKPSATTSEPFQADTGPANDGRGRVPNPGA